MRGQITLVNLTVLFVVLLLWLVGFLPVVNGAINTAVAGLLAAPNSNTPYLVTLIQLIPFAVTLGIILTGLNYAIPRREGVG